jgi:hypothetical protein
MAITDSIEENRAAKRSIKRIAQWLWNSPLGPSLDRNPAALVLARDALARSAAVKERHVQNRV